MPQQPSPPAARPLLHSQPTNPLVYLLVGVALLGFAMLVVARLFWFETFRFPSSSMHPTLPVGAFVLVDKRGFGGSNTTSRIGIGDLVVFAYPRDPSQTFLKRVVGMPGDRIVFEDGMLVRNDVPGAIEEATADDQFVYWRERLDTVDHLIARTKNPQFEPRDGEWIVPPGHYFVSGDNRDNSEDSRYWGYVGEDAVLGRVIHVF